MPEEHLLPAELMPAPVDLEALDQYLDTIAAGEDVAVPEELVGFDLASLQHAEWAMRKLADAQAHQQQLDQQATEWAHQIEVWHAAESARVAARARYFEGLLVQYMHERRAEDERVKTVRMPSGVIESTARKARPVITDEDQLVEWARKHAPDVVQTKTTYRVPSAALASLGGLVEIEQEGPAGERIFRVMFAYAGEDDGPVPVPGVEVVAGRVDVRVKPTVGG